jgi:hypothetical protein
MGNEKLCDCGSPADWAEVGSTWICVACRDKEVTRNLDELKGALAKMQRAEKVLRTMEVDTVSIEGLLSRLETEINNIAG